MLSLLLTAVACSPPAAPPADAPAVAEEPAAPAADMGPYSNSWDAAEFSRFRHTLNAPTPGDYQLTLTASTNSPGGETVAVYPVGPDGAAATARIMFVVTTTAGSESRTETVSVPAEGLPVEVAIENASGRPFAGTYTLTLAPPG
jgi:hypothetical protein